MPTAAAPSPLVPAFFLPPPQLLQVREKTTLTRIDDGINILQEPHEIGRYLRQDPPLGAHAVRPPPPVREVEALEGSRQDVLERHVGLRGDPSRQELRPQHADAGGQGKRVAAPHDVEPEPLERSLADAGLQGLLYGPRIGRLAKPQLLQFGTSPAELGDPVRDGAGPVVHHRQLETGHVRERGEGRELEGVKVVVFAKVDGQILERRGHVVDHEGLEREGHSQLLHGEVEAPQGPTRLLVAVTGAIVMT
ncbi:hypothetical protein PG993_012752 [Apiospora rasikravindrae]|uniref:Uncharacterized protein n=1 Tax=Apiospora rasikravindrae TaxID=990691 RepID=A0ABR1RVP3_9PEZI